MDSFAFSLIVSLAQDTLDLAADFAENGDLDLASRELDDLQTKVGHLRDLLTEDPATVKSRGNRSPQEIKALVVETGLKFFGGQEPSAAELSPLQPLLIQPKPHDFGASTPHQPERPNP